MTKNKKRPVHKYWLMSIWSPVGEGQKADDLVHADMNKPADVALLVDGYLRPYFHSIPPGVASKIKDAWRYGLHAWSDRDLRHGLQSILPLFGPPEDIRHFYIDVWRRLFGDEPWEVTDPDSYQELTERVSSPWGVVGHVPS